MIRSICVVLLLGLSLAFVTNAIRSAHCDFPQGASPLNPNNNQCTSASAADTQEDCEQSYYPSITQCYWNDFYGYCTSLAAASNEDNACPFISSETTCNKTSFLHYRRCEWYDTISDQPSQNPSVRPSLTPSDMPSTAPSTHPSSIPSIVPSASPTTVNFCGLPYSRRSSRELCSNATSESECGRDSVEVQVHCFWSNGKCTSEYAVSGEDAVCPIVPLRSICISNSYTLLRPCVWHEPLQPTALPSPEPSSSPSTKATKPFITPKPTPSPTERPTPQPTRRPTPPPTPRSTPQPTPRPTTNAPTPMPTQNLTSPPSLAPSVRPFQDQSDAPAATVPVSGSPDRHPSSHPSHSPTTAPSSSRSPSATPSSFPTTPPTALLSNAPTLAPSLTPTEKSFEQLVRICQCNENLICIEGIPHSQGTELNICGSAEDPVHMHRVEWLRLSQYPINQGVVQEETGLGGEAVFWAGGDDVSSFVVRVIVDDAFFEIPEGVLAANGRVRYSTTTNQLNHLQMNQSTMFVDSNDTLLVVSNDKFTFRLDIPLERTKVVSQADAADHDKRNKNLRVFTPVAIAAVAIFVLLAFMLRTIATRRTTTRDGDDLSFTS